MALWKVRPSWKKSLVERQYWTREDGPYIVNEMCWRTGEFIIETEDDEPPVIDEDTNLFDLTDHWETSEDRKSTRLNSSHSQQSRMPSSA